MFGWTEEQQMIGKMIRRWATEKLEPATPGLEKGEEPYALFRDFAKTFGVPDMVKGYFAKLEAKAAGGGAPADAEASPRGGLDPGLPALFTYELSRVNPGFFLCFGASLGLAGGAIMSKGTLAQKIRWGLPILTTEKIGAWGMTEPGAGSDAFGAMRTTARPVRGGEAFVLSGQKTFITNAPYADIHVVYAKLDDGSGVPLERRPFHAFVLEKGMKGFVQGPAMQKMGMHSSPTGELFLEDVEVTKDRLLGESLDARGAGKDGAKDVFHGERTSMAAMGLGIIDRSLEIATAYAKQRITWGKPIAEYQLVQEKLARMFVHKLNVENLLWRQLWMAKNKKGMSAAEASATKLYGARAATECALEAIQILGGNGYMQEYVVERLMRDAKLLQIGGGTDEIQILAIARSVLAV